MKNILDVVILLEMRLYWIFLVSLSIFVLIIGLYISSYIENRELKREIKSLNHSVILYMAQQDSITVRLNDAKIWLFKPEKE